MVNADKTVKITRSDQRKCNYKKEFFSIVIVTLNSQEHIKACLESVLAQSYKGFEIFLVDNGSTDQTVEMAQKCLAMQLDTSQFEIIKNTSNLGFCTANNQGIEKSKGEFILLLNSDVVLDKFFIDSALDIIHRKPRDYGIFNPKILKPDHMTVDSLGLRLSSNKRFYNLYHGQTDQNLFEQSMDIFGACGAAAICKKEMLDEIKESESDYLDSRFFFLGEDFELAWRARKAGWKSLYIPHPLCFHSGNCSGFADKRRQYLSFRNRYYLIIKHEGTLALLKYIIRPYDVVRFFYMLFTNPKGLFTALKDIYKFIKTQKQRT